MIKVKDIKKMLENNIITKDEYDTIISRLQPPKSVDNYTWGDVIDGYYDYCTKKYTITTAKGYKTCVMKFVMYCTGSFDYDAALREKFKVFTFQKVNAFVNWMAEKALTYHTMNKIKYALIVLCDYVKTLNLSVPDISNINIPDNEKVSEIVPLMAQDEIYKVAESAETRARLCILLCYEGALKRQEICKVRFDDFDYNKCQLNIYDDKGQFVRVCVLNKYIIYLVENYKEILYNNIDKWNKSRIKKGKPVRDDKGYVFQNIKTTTPSYPSLQTLIKNAAKNYYKNAETDQKTVTDKVSNFTFETLRNSKRLYLLSKGYTVNQVMNIIGDKNCMSTCRFQKYIPIYYPDSYGAKE